MSSPRTRGPIRRGLALWHAGNRLRREFSQIQLSNEHTGIVTTVFSPVTGIVCHRRWRSCLRQFDSSVGAPGPHDFAVRLSTVRYRRIRVHRIPPRGRDDREPPLQRDGTPRVINLICPTAKAKYFLQTGLDRKSTDGLICPSGSHTARVMPECFSLIWSPGPSQL
jgi:hypothetical protein